MAEDIQSIEKQPVSPEQEPVSPEQESVVEKPAPKIEQQAIEQPGIQKPVIKSQTEAEPVMEKITHKQIESILSEGLEQTYESLDENLKQEFRIKGEQTASQIQQIISQAKIVVHKIINLIKAWLSIIPNVNNFFLEQETKIKTDKILKLAEKNKKQT